MGGSSAKARNASQLLHRDEAESVTHRRGRAGRLAAALAAAETAGMPAATGSRGAADALSPGP